MSELQITQDSHLPLYDYVNPDTTEPIFELLTKYFRLQVLGKNNIPKEGRSVIISNHSGFLGVDVLMLHYHITKITQNPLQVMAHKLWFSHPELAYQSKKYGLIPASLTEATQVLKQDRQLLIFPEGEEGNFKESKLRYRLRHFHTGFAQLALKTESPITPAYVIGAEETSLTLSQIKWTKPFIGSVLPIPLNLLPLPVRWKIKFLPPIPHEEIKNKTPLQISRKVRHLLQHKIHIDLKKTRFLF